MCDATVWLIRRIPDDEGLAGLARVRTVNRDRVAVRKSHFGRLSRREGRHTPRRNRFVRA